MEELTIQEVVFMKMLAEFPTEQLERNLAPEASLRVDLGLKKAGLLGDEILTVAMSIEQYYKEERDWDFHIPDTEIQSWVTVQDIINTLINILK